MWEMCTFMMMYVDCGDIKMSRRSQINFVFQFMFANTADERSFYTWSIAGVDDGCKSPYIAPIPVFKCLFIIKSFEKTLVDSSDQSSIQSKYPIINGRDNRKIKGESRSHTTQRTGWNYNNISKYFLLYG